MYFRLIVAFAAALMSVACETDSRTDDASAHSVVMGTDYDRRISSWSIFGPERNESGDKVLGLFQSAQFPWEMDFVIVCTEEGGHRYQIEADFPLRSGQISYRIGHHPPVHATWSVADHGRTLFAPQYDVRFIRDLALTQMLALRVDRSGEGPFDFTIDTSSLSAALDQTREFCNWPEDQLPSDNGWGRELPSELPLQYVEVEYAEQQNDNQLRVIAWRDKNVNGQTQILVRLGEVGEACQGSASPNRLLIDQFGARILPTAGIEISNRCDNPITLPLAGAFNADAPLRILVTKPEQTGQVLSVEQRIVIGRATLP